MSLKRGRPPEVKHGARFGPVTNERRLRNPFDDELDFQYGNRESKTLEGPANTASGVDMDLHHNYNSWWGPEEKD